MQLRIALSRVEKEVLMDKNSIKYPLMACREHSRRAMSLLELTIVVAILGLLSVAAVTRYGHDSLNNGGAEGLARKLALSLNYARRCTISTGENHYLKLINTGSGIDSYAIFNRVSGAQVDETRTVPEGLTVSSGNIDLEFDFDGSALFTYYIIIIGDKRIYQLTVDMLPGTVQIVKLN